MSVFQQPGISAKKRTISDARRLPLIYANAVSALCGQAKGQYATVVVAYLALRIEERATPRQAIRRRYSGAARDTKLLALREGGLLLGVRSNEPYPEQEFFLQPGDPLSSLALYGRVVDATGPDGLEFGWGRLEEFIRSHAQLSADRFAGELLHEVFAWPASNTKHLQWDDITIVVIDVEGQIQPASERSRQDQISALSRWQCET